MRETAQQETTDMVPSGAIDPSIGMVPGLYRTSSLERPSVEKFQRSWVGIIPKASKRYEWSEMVSEE